VPGNRRGRVDGEPADQTGLKAVTLEAATGLIIAHGTWLAREDFTRFIHHGSGTAAIDWEAATSAMDSGELPCSGRGRRILRFAASLGRDVPVGLGETITGD
jgi:hypothetical protein